jgi:sirohydrochlorin ferrochelatase
VPNALPPEAPALVVAVAGHSGTPDVAAEVTSIVRVDNPSVDVRMARVGTDQEDPSGLRAVLNSAAAGRPADQPAAIVVPLLALPFPAVTDAIRYDVTQSGVNARIAEPFNVSLTFAEALHIRLADARLARADRVRMFSIPTSADGIIVATAGGSQAAAAATPTAVLLAARLALPVFAAALDGSPSIGEAAAQLRQMGVGRIAIAPCIIGPEARPGELESVCAAIGADSAAPLGAHDSVAKLVTLAYGQALEQIEESSAS